MYLVGANHPHLVCDPLLGPIGNSSSTFSVLQVQTVSFRVQYMDVSENSRTPKIIHELIGFSIIKPSILGYPYFRKHPYLQFYILFVAMKRSSPSGITWVVLTRCTPKRRNIWGPCLRRLTTLLWREHPLGTYQTYLQPPVYERKTSYKPTNQINVEGNKSMMICSK